MQAIAFEPKNPRTIYVGTRDGVYKTTDAGVTWKAAGSLRDVAALAVHPRKDGVIYAVTADGRVHRTSNGGQSWEARTAGR